MPPWPLPAPRPPVVYRVLSRLMLACRDVTLLWGGVAFGGTGAGADEGWLARLSLDAEASLAQMHSLAVYAADATPGAPLCAAEERATRAAAARLGNGTIARASLSDDEGEDDDDEVDLDAAAAVSLKRSLTPTVAAAASATRDEWAVEFGRLTARTPGLGVLVAEARAGRCRASIEALGMALGDVRLFSSSGGSYDSPAATLSRELHSQESAPLPSSQAGEAGSAIDVRLDPSVLRTAAAIAPHILKAYRIAVAAGSSSSGG